MPLLMQDRDLLARFRAGEAKALDRVYREYHPGVVAFLRNGFSFDGASGACRFHGYRRPSDLESATQEVFLRAFEPRARAAYDGLRPFGTYLLGIARNYVISDFRRRQLVLGLFTAEDTAPAATSVPAQEPRPALDIEIEEREVERLVAEFRKTMSEREQTLFRLRFEEELSQNEAAARMRMTRIRIRRIEAKLKIRLLDFLRSAGYLERYGRDHVGNRSLWSILF